LSWAEGALQTADEATDERKEPRLVRSIFIPEEETCFYLFRAASPDAVRQVAGKWGLTFERIMRVLPESAASFVPGVLIDISDKAPQDGAGGQRQQRDQLGLA
jgi:hypothetical protein